MRLPLWLKRLVMAYQFRCWPWLIPDATVRYVALDQRLTPAEMEAAARVVALLASEPGKVKATARVLEMLTEQSRRGRG